MSGPGQQVLAIDPGQSFGSGYHASTRLALGGALVLSGMLADLQADEVGAVYEALGCRRVSSRAEGEWEALLLTS